MGSIKKTISFDDYVWDSYLSGYDGDNFSKHIQKLIVAGFEAIDGKQDIYKKQVITLTNKLTDKDIEIRNLKALVQRLKKGSSKTPSGIIDKYSLTNQHINFLKERKDFIFKEDKKLKDKIILRQISKEEAKNINLMEGNHSRFVNETGKNISLNEFKTLINSDLDKLLKEISGNEVDQS